MKPFRHHNLLLLISISLVTSLVLPRCPFPAHAISPRLPPTTPYTRPSLADTTPLLTPDGESTKPYPVFISTGRSTLLSLVAAIRARTPDETHWPPLTDSYTLLRKPSQLTLSSNLNGALPSLYHALGVTLDPATEFVGYEITSTAPLGVLPLMDVSLHPASGSIVVADFHAVRDRHKGVLRLPVSELMWQVWRGEGGRGVAWVAVMSLVGVQGVAVVERVWEQVGGGRGVRVFAPGRGRVQEKRAFWALAGVDVVRPVARLLRGHREMVGDRIVTKIAVSRGETIDILIEIKPARRPAVGPGEVTQVEARRTVGDVVEVVEARGGE